MENTSIYFPYELDSLTLGAPTPDSLTLKVDDVTLLTMDSVPEGLTKLTALYPLISDGMAKLAPGLHTLTLTPVNSEEQTYQIMKCRARLRQRAAAFTERHFLTLARMEGYPKYVPLDGKERLYYYVDDSDADNVHGVYFILTYYNESVGVKRIITSKSPTTMDGGNNEAKCYMCEFSVNDLIEWADRPDDTLPWRLLEVTARAGLRTARYVPRDRRLWDGPVRGFYFENAFGLTDTLWCWGAATRALKPTYSQANVDGVMITYNVEAVPTWEVQTGMFEDGLLPLLDDFLASPSIRRAEDDVQVVVTEANVKTSDDYADYHTATFTIREAGRDAVVLTADVPDGVFDDTFDNTFE